MFILTIITLIYTFYLSYLFMIVIVFIIAILVVKLNFFYHQDSWTQCQTGSVSAPSTGGTSAGGAVQLQGVVVDAVSSLRPVWELLDAGVPVVHPADLTVLQPSQQISNKQAAWAARRRTLQRENRTSEMITLSKSCNRDRKWVECKYTHPTPTPPSSDLHHLGDERSCSGVVEWEEEERQQEEETHRCHTQHEVVPHACTPNRRTTTLPQIQFLFSPQPHDPVIKISTRWNKHNVCVKLFTLINTNLIICTAFFLA